MSKLENARYLITEVLNNIEILTDIKYRGDYTKCINSGGFDILHSDGVGYKQRYILGLEQILKDIDRGVVDSSERFKHMDNCEDTWNKSHSNQRKIELGYMYRSDEIEDSLIDKISRRRLNLDDNENYEYSYFLEDDCDSGVDYISVYLNKVYIGKESFMTLVKDLSSNDKSLTEEQYKMAKDELITISHKVLWDRIDKQVERLGIDGQCWYRDSCGYISEIYNSLGVYPFEVMLDNYAHNISTNYAEYVVLRIDHLFDEVFQDVDDETFEKLYKGNEELLELYNFEFKKYHNTRDLVDYSINPEKYEEPIETVDEIVDTVDKRGMIPVFFRPTEETLKEWRDDMALTEQGDNHREYRVNIEFNMTELTIDEVKAFVLKNLSDGRDIIKLDDYSLEMYWQVPVNEGVHEIEIALYYILEDYKYGVYKCEPIIRCE